MTAPRTTRPLRIVGDYVRTDHVKEFEAQRRDRRQSVELVVGAVILSALAIAAHVVMS